MSTDVEHLKSITGASPGGGGGAAAAAAAGPANSEARWPAAHTKAQTRPHSCTHRGGGGGFSPTTTPPPSTSTTTLQKLSPI